jgi:hypothetical protein
VSSDQNGTGHASRITHHGASASNYRSPECQQLAFSTIGINVAQE